MFANDKPFRTEETAGVDTWELSRSIKFENIHKFFKIAQRTIFFHVEIKRYVQMYKFLIILLTSVTMY